MVYTSFALLFRAGTLMEGAFIALAAVLVAAYGLAIWRAPRSHVQRG